MSNVQTFSHLPKSNVISSEKFSYKDGVFSAFVSDFGPDWKPTQIYITADAVGFNIRSEKTGNVQQYLWVATETQDQAVVSWTFVPICSKETSDEVRNTKVIIFND